MIFLLFCQSRTAGSQNGSQKGGFGRVHRFSIASSCNIFIMDQKQEIEAQYRAHHERGKRYGYLFCHGSRGPYIQRWIGEGKKVLDLGCRDGMLTQFYTKNNQVLGVDIDRQRIESGPAKTGNRNDVARS